MGGITDKVAAITAWPIPRSPRALRGFLGLAGYYRKYILDFGLIAAPLTRLLRRDASAWDAEATEAFHMSDGSKNYVIMLVSTVCRVRMIL